MLNMSVTKLLVLLYILQTIYFLSSHIRFCIPSIIAYHIFWFNFMSRTMTLLQNLSELHRSRVYSNLGYNFVYDGKFFIIVFISFILYIFHWRHSMKNFLKIIMKLLSASFTVLYKLNVPRTPSSSFSEYWSYKWRVTRNNYRYDQLGSTATSNDNTQQVHFK